MNGVWAKVVGGCAAVGLLAGAAALLLPSTQAHAASDTSWSAYDHTQMFLHDLTAGSATYAGAFLLDADGQITGQLAHMHTVKFAPIGSKVAAAKSSAPVALEATLDRVVLVNDSGQSMIAYFQTTQGMIELRLLPGEGIAIGELSETTVKRFRWGCKCVCQHGDSLYQTAIMFCEDVFPQHPAGASCDCTSLVTTPCWFENEMGVLVEGQMNGCKSGLLPVPPTGI